MTKQQKYDSFPAIGEVDNPMYLFHILMFQFIKFASVGAINTAIDFGVLNGLILVFGLGPQGMYFGLFKSISFTCAVINSFFLNKYWVFRKRESTETKEPILFVLISLLGMFLNVGISHGVFQALSEVNELPTYAAVNIGALVGTAFVLAFNFFGYKFLVFKKKNHV